MYELCRKFLERFEIEETLCSDFAHTLQAVGLTQEQLTFAQDVWMPQHWDLSSRGVRLCIGAYLREFIQVGTLPQALAQGKKLVYGITPSQAVLFTAIKKAGGEQVYVGYPDFILAIVLGGFFNRVDLFSQPTNYLETGCRHCALNRIRLNAAIKQVLPKPHALWSWGLYCDEAPKVDELLSLFTGEDWNSVTMRIPHDATIGEREDENPLRVKYLAAQYRQAHNEIAQRTGITINPSLLTASLLELSQLTRDLDELTLLTTEQDPQPLGGNELALFTTYLTVHFDTDSVYFNTALREILHETKEKVAKGMGVLPKGAPKLGCHFLPICVPWVDRAFLKCGVSLSFSSHHSFATVLFQPLHSLDPYEMAAELWLRQPNSVNAGYQIELMCQQLERYSVDGMLYGFFTFDRWLGSHQKMTLPRIEEETEVQHFYLEGDFWDDANYKEDERRGRIESIAALMKSHKLLSYLQD